MPGISPTSRSSTRHSWATSCAQDGVQVKWLAPTDLFVEIGAETGNGHAFPGTRRNRNGMNGTTLFAHVGGDIGDIGELARRRDPGSTCDAEDRSFEDTDAARCTRREFVHRQVAHLGSGCGPQVGADRQFALSAPEGPGEYMSRREDRRTHLRRRGPAALADAYRSDAIRLVPAERVSVPAALARRACATTRSIPARRASRS